MIVAIEKPGTPAELVHYGVKGMRWGVIRRKDQALISKAKKINEQKKQARREAKAEKFVKKSSELQTAISKLEAKPKQTAAERFLYNREAHIQLLKEAQAKAEKAAEDTRQGKLTDTQKRLLIGGAVVGGILVGSYVAAKMNSGEARQFMNRGKAFMTGKKYKFKEDPVLATRDLSPDGIKTLIMSDINPDYPDLGTTMNCRRATFAYELRRRGYDVQATKTPNGSGQNAAGLLNAIDTRYKDVKTSNRAVAKRLFSGDVKNPVDRHINAFTKRNGSLRNFEQPQFLFKDLAKSQPERSRGEITLMWAAGGGHSMAYEIIGGKAHLFDSQSGKHYTSFNQIYDDIGAVREAGFTRLDNMELDKHFLERWVKNVD